MFVYRRLLHSSASKYAVQTAATSKTSSPLSVLRKKTGYSLSHCRTALQQFNDNLEQVGDRIYQLKSHL
jgi:translation elongation factor EF-Ts